MSRRLIQLVLAGAGVTMMGFSWIEREPTLLYNPSPSAPTGWYKISSSETYDVGDLVAAWLPKDAEKLAAERRYLPIKTPVIKTIIAAPGDRYCVENGYLIIDEATQFEIFRLDREGRVMPLLPVGCRRLGVGRFLIVSKRIGRSFDSRYFGEIDRSLIIGTAEVIGWAEGHKGRDNLEKGGARGSGAQGKIKGGCTKPGLTPCLHIDFYGTKPIRFALSNPAITCIYCRIGWHYRMIVHDSSRRS